MLYNIVVFAIHQRESAIGIHVPPTPILSSPPSPPRPSRLSRALTLGFLLHASNSHWPSILHMALCMFQCYNLRMV